MLFTSQVLEIMPPVGFVSASAVLPAYYHLSKVIGSCISGSGTCCVSFIGLCVTSMIIGQIWSFGRDISDWLSSIFDSVSSSSSDVSKAIANESNVINQQARVPSDTSSPNNPSVNPGPPPNCFLKLGGSYFTNADGKAPAELVGVGSNAYFGLTLPDNVVLRAVDECQGVYKWDSGDLQPDFQVDCTTNELGAYWNGVKQACYTYFMNDSEFAIMCGNNMGSIYLCLHSSGLYGRLIPAFINWATS
ncbi:hypothetical protein ONZ51_g1146 [Trametes cubensis]|uniref:Uncharacterized protein n=1 Tax=Trametes cubensis TaxID=1111947 RepID=A0AAD7U202_9APHY|nr:hypothetical protein ONZ51_g1146 [Trametes cubensis]